MIEKIQQPNTDPASDSSSSKHSSFEMTTPWRWFERIVVILFGAAIGAFLATIIGFATGLIGIDC